MFVLANLSDLGEIKRGLVYVGPLSAVQSRGTPAFSSKPPRTPGELAPSAFASFRHNAAQRFGRDVP